MLGRIDSSRVDVFRVQSRRTLHIPAVSGDRLELSAFARSAQMRPHLGNFFGEPAPLAPVAQRVEQVLQAIDWSRPDIVLWLPGTSERFLQPEFEKAMLHLGHRPVPVIYQASWRFLDSVPDGNEVLRGVIDGIMARGSNHRVFLAGQSQGAWVISNLLQDPARSAIVSRVALFGHPGVAPGFSKTPSDSRVLEINNPGDPVSMPIKGDPSKIATAIDQIARKRFWPHVGVMLGLIIRNPRALWGFLKGKLNLILPNAPDPHDYRPHMPVGARFLVSGERPAGGHGGVRPLRPSSLRARMG